jgi:hypothetical protein
VAYTSPHPDPLPERAFLGFFGCAIWGTAASCVQSTIRGVQIDAIGATALILVADLVFEWSERRSLKSIRRAPERGSDSAAQSRSSPTESSAPFPEKLRLVLLWRAPLLARELLLVFSLPPPSLLAQSPRCSVPFFGDVLRRLGFGPLGLRAL